MMIIMHPVWRLSVLFSSILLALGLPRVNADGETVRIPCGETQNVTSPNYPHHYPDNSMTHWFIEVDPGERIIVTFNDFQTEIGDFLYMLEENYPTAEAKYSGIKPFTPYVSLGNHLQMVFESDRSRSDKGFHLSISCLKEINITGVHAAFEGLEYIRILKQPICRDDWHMHVADTVCREAGFTGSYEADFTTNTSGFANDSEINSTICQCSELSFRLQDCMRSPSKCTVAYESVVIKCNLLGELGCFNLGEYSHLQTGSVNLSRDQCVAYCKAYSIIPQYAVHHQGNGCSCIDQTALDLTRLSQQRDRCQTDTESETGHWATLLNVSFGCCNEPPQVNNGDWKTTSNAYIFGTSISAECNDGYKLVDGDGVLRCDFGMNSSSLDFEWHGSIPSCQENSKVTLTSTTPKTTSNINGTGKNVTAFAVPVSLIVLIFLIILIVVLIWYIRRLKSAKDGDQIDLCSASEDGESQQRGCRLICCLQGVFHRTIYQPGIV